MEVYWLVPLAYLLGSVPTGRCANNREWQYRGDECRAHRWPVAGNSNASCGHRERIYPCNPGGHPGFDSGRECLRRDRGVFRSPVSGILAVPGRQRSSNGSGGAFSTDAFRYFAIDCGLCGRDILEPGDFSRFDRYRGGCAGYALVNVLSHICRCHEHVPRGHGRHPPPCQHPSVGRRHRTEAWVLVLNNDFDSAILAPPVFAVIGSDRRTGSQAAGRDTTAVQSIALESIGDRHCPSFR